MLSSFGIRALLKLQKKFFLSAGHFRTQSFSFTMGWGSGTYWRALVEEGMRGLTMCGDARWFIYM